MAYVKEPVTKSNLKITCEFSTIILFIPGEFLALYNGELGRTQINEFRKNK